MQQRSPLDAFDQISAYVRLFQGYACEFSLVLRHLKAISIMSPSRVLQNVLLKSIRLSPKKAFIAAPVARASFVANRGNLATAYSNNSFFARNYNTEAPHSDKFKVVDFNDIQSIIKKDGKVSQ